MMASIVTLLVFGFVAIAALGHLLLLNAIVLGKSDSKAPVVAHDGPRAERASSVA